MAKLEKFPEVTFDEAVDAFCLKNTGCSRVFGLTLVKSLGNN
jgi:hypothetical protein